MILDRCDSMSRKEFDAAFDAVMQQLSVTSEEDLITELDSYGADSLGSAFGHRHVMDSTLGAVPPSTVIRKAEKK